MRRAMVLANLVLGLFLLYSAAFFNIHWVLRVLDVGVGIWCLHGSYNYFFGSCGKDTCCRK